MTDKPNLTRVWASGAPGANVVDPDVAIPGKFAAGWDAEIPPFEYFNFLQQLFTQALAHINEHGIADWDSATAYPANAWARGSDNLIYVSKIATTGNNPVSSPTQWRPLIQTSSTDTTAGGLMAVGAFGLGVGIQISSVLNLNSLTQNGVYYHGNNQPGSAFTGNGVVYVNGINPSYGHQFNVDITTQQVWTRTVSAGTWSAWVEVLRRGDNGLGSGSCPTPSGNDLNNATANGWYEFSATTANKPGTIGAGVVLAAARAAGARVAQMAFENDGSLSTATGIAIREFDGSSWSAWTTLLRTGDHGIGATSLAFTSNLNIIPQGSLKTWNVSTSGRPVTSYGEVLNLPGDSVDTGSQIAFDHDNTKAYFRTLKAGTWGAWKELVSHNDSPTFGSGGISIRLKGGATGTSSVEYISFEDSAGTQQGWLGYGGTSNNDLTINNSIGNRIRCRIVGGEDALDINPSASGGVKVLDYSSAQRRCGWQSGRIPAGGSFTLDNGYLGNRVDVSASGITITVPTSLTADDMVVIINNTAGAITIAQGSGKSLRWLSGGSLATGNRTLAAYSVATIENISGGEARLWGVGLS